MSTAEIALRTLLAFALVLAHAYVTLRVTLALRLGRSLFLHGAAFLTVGMWGAASAFHLLLACHLYSLPAACTLAVVACAVAARATRALPPTRLVFDRVLCTLTRIQRLSRASRWRGRTYFFGATALVLFVHTVPLIPFGHDTLVYHGTKAALWLQRGDLGAMWGPGQWAVYGLYPGGAEIFASLALLPFHYDLYTATVDYVMWLGLGGAVFALARELGVREPYGSLGAGFVLLIPTLHMLVGSGYVESTLCLTFVLGAYFTARYVRDPRGPIAMLAMAAFGLAASTKFSMFLPAALGAGTVFLRAVLTRGKRRSGIAYGIAGGVAALVVVAPWLLNSMRFTGYPLSPMPITFAGIKLGVSREVETFMSLPYPPPYRWETEWPLIKETFRLPVGAPRETIGVFGALPLALLPFGVARLLVRKTRIGLAITALTAAALWTYLTPQMAQVRFTWVQSSSRFLLPALCLIVPVALAADRHDGWLRRWFGHGLWAGAVINAFALTWIWISEYDAQAAVLLTPLAAVLFSVAIATFRRWQQRRPLAVLAVAAGCAAVFSVALTAFREPRRYEFVQFNASIHPFAHPWWPAAEAVDRAPYAPLRIAMTSGPGIPCIWPAYLFLGRKLQNELSYVSPLPDGRLPGFCPSDGWEPQASYEAWERRLLERDIDYVVTFGPASVELAWMNAHPERFEVTVGLGDAGLFRVRKADARPSAK